MKGAPVVLIVILIVLGFSLFVDLKPKNVNAVAFTDAPLYTKSENPLDYAHLEHYDTNRDGVVTKKELAARLIAKDEYRKDAKTIHEYMAKTKELQFDHDLKLAFAKSLNPMDRKLVEGLSFNEAKKAIHLPNKIKAQALRLEIREKALYIQKHI